jgi:PAS domain S-box-containing protein
MQTATASPMRSAPRWRAYALACVLTVSVLALRMALSPWVGDRPILILFFIPIVISAFYGGLGPGLLATALVGLVTDLYVLPPIGTLWFEKPLDFAQWLFMLLEGVLISVLFADLDRWRRRSTRDALTANQTATERKVRVGFAIALTLLGTVGIVSYLSVVRLNENSKMVAHSHEVMSVIDELVASTTSAESAHRAFIISGEEQFASSFEGIATRTDELAARLKTLVSDNPLQASRVDPFVATIKTRHAHSRAAIDVRRKGGLEAILDLAKVPRPGPALQDRLQGLAAELKATEESLLRERERSARGNAVMSQIVIVGGSVLAIAIMGLALYAIRRDFAGRARAEREIQEANEQLEARVEQRTAELAQANETLRKSERRFRALIEHGSDSIALIDAGNRILYLSPAVANVEGYLPEELLGRLGTEHTHPDDLPVIGAAVEKLLAQPGKPISVVWRRRHKDGRWIWLEGVATNLLDDPSVGAIVTNYRDITDRLAHETRLGEQLQRLALMARITRAIGERQDLRSIFQVVVRSIEDELPVDFCAISLYDMGENQLTVSCVGIRTEPIATSLGMSENTLVPIDENGLSRCVQGHLVYEPDIATSKFPFPQRLASAGMRSLVIAPLLVESQVFGVLITARRTPEAFSSGECEFLRQASEHTALASHQAQLYGALQRAYDDLRTSQQQVMQQERLRALGQMASGIAHDINNAISPVALYTEALLEREPNLSERARSQLEIIQRAIDDIAQTVARMGEFYRSREPQVSLLPVDLNKLIGQVIALTRARWSDMAQQRGAAIDVRTELAADLPLIAAAESQVRDALVNLVFNAVDAMPEGGPLTIRTGLSAGSHSQIVLLEVEDRGIGMDEDTRRRCLEPFFTTKGTRGTGLGLAMVYGVAQRHGANLEIESVPGKGTLVRMNFAIAQPAAAVSSGPHRAPAGPLRILIIDDDPLLLKSLRDALETDGHDVTSANGGQAGIEAFVESHAAGTPFPVVITDLGMPHVDGRKVASTIKGSVPATLVIMLTGWGRRLVAEGDVPSGVDQVLSKPPKLIELRAALARIDRR